MPRLRFTRPSRRDGDRVPPTIGAVISSLPVELQVVFDGVPVGGFDALARLARDDRLRGSPRAEWSVAMSTDR